ncbi:MAG: glycerate kinase [Acidimicrobiaceae bacterium]|nr:glycerate kinase [Acidimicrobiaceae bacterium]
MRILVAPDKFKGTASAQVVAESIRTALGNDDTVYLQPLADGGEGTVQAFGGPNRNDTVLDPHNNPVEAQWRLHGDFAVIEMAEASGLTLVGGPENNDPIAATTYGTGQLIAIAIERGAREILVGAGGSATTDGGLGALEALHPLQRLREVSITIACDVKTPFNQAAETFGPQKGASPSQVQFLKRRLERVAQMYLEDRGKDVSTMEMAGAAGGFAGGLASVGATLVNGFDAVSEAVELLDSIEKADLVITGEGHVDESSFGGKVVGGVLELARETGTPAIIIAGGWEKSVTPSVPIYGLEEEVGRDNAYTKTQKSIALVAEKAISNWKKGR